MPHFSSEDLREGLLGKFESTQGNYCNNTVFIMVAQQCRSLFNDEFVETDSVASTGCMCVTRVRERKREGGKEKCVREDTAFSLRQI